MHTQKRQTDILVSIKTALRREGKVQFAYFLVPRTLAQPDPIVWRLIFWLILA